MPFSYAFKIFLFVMVSVLAFLVWYLIKAAIKSSNEKKHRDAVVKKKVKNNHLYALYKKLVSFKLTQNYVKKLQRSYEIRIPGDLRQTREKAALTAILIWSGYALAVVAMCFLQPSLLMWATVLYSAYIFADQYVRTSLAKLDLKLINELSTLIDEVRFHYFEFDSVEEALEASLEKAPKLIKMHAEKIYNIITSAEMDIELARYCDVVPSYFLKMFADTCSKIVKYGDKIVDNQSLFLRSIQALKEEIQIEQLRQMKLDSKFKFTTAVAVIPIYAIQPFINFGKNCFSDLEDLFGGSYGVAATVLCFIVDFAVYRILLTLRDRIHINLQQNQFWDNIYEMKPIKKVVDSLLVKNWGKTMRLEDLLKKTGSTFTAKTFIVKKAFYFVLAFVMFNGLFIFSTIQEKNIASTNVSKACTGTSGSTDEESLEMLFLARQLLENYKEQDIRRMYNASVGGGSQAAMDFNNKVTEFLKEKLQDDLSQAVEIDERLAYTQVAVYLKEHESTKAQIQYLKDVPYEVAAANQDTIGAGFSQFQLILTLASRKDSGLSEDAKNEIVDVVSTQIKKYQNSYFRWTHMFASLILAVFAYNLPFWVLLYEKKSLQMDMDDEVIQYKSSIMLLMHFNRMTTEVILESMLLISSIFKKSIQKCIGNLPLDENDAYDKLIRDEPFNSFHRLVENLRMVDKVGVKRAFDTVESERKNYQEMRKQENEISINQRGALAEFISMLPVYFVIGAYMVVPFIIAAVQQFNEAMSMSSKFM